MYEKRHSIHVEFFGVGAYYSVQYEYLQPIKNRNFVSFNAGGAYKSLSPSFMGHRNDNNDVLLLFRPSYTKQFSEKAFGDIGINVLFIWYVEPDFDIYENVKILPSPQFGFRYNLGEKGFHFRSSISFAFFSYSTDMERGFLLAPIGDFKPRRTIGREPGFFVNMGLGIGYSF